MDHQLLHYPPKLIGLRYILSSIAQRVRAFFAPTVPPDKVTIDIEKLLGLQDYTGKVIELHVTSSKPIAITFDKNIKISTNGSIVIDANRHILFSPEFHKEDTGGVTGIKYPFEDIDTLITKIEQRSRELQMDDQEAIECTCVSCKTGGE